MAKNHGKKKARAREVKKPRVAQPDAVVDALRSQANQLGFSAEQQAFVATLLGSLTDLGQEREALSSELARSELRVKKLTYLAYGKKTERLSREEVEQLALSFGGTPADAKADEPDVPHAAAPEEPIDSPDAAQDSPAEATATSPSSPKRKRPNHPGRSKLAPELERIIDAIAVPAEQRVCACCQHEMSVISHVDHERIEYIPAKVIVHVERREKLACRRSECRKDIATAPRTDDGGSRRRAGATLFAHMIESKCDDGMPLERQRDQLRRLGFEVPANTLYTYWTHATSLLLPVAKIVLAQVLADPVVGVDDTSLSVLDKERKGGIYKGHLWCFTSLRPLVAYTFTESWTADEIAPYLSAIDGFVQCDDYKGYSRQVTLSDGTRRALVDPERRLGCMMHVRRRFHEALRLGDKRAARGIELIAAVYDIERAAKEGSATAEQRRELRSDFSLPLLDAFDTWVDDLAVRCLPRSPLGEALGYAKHQRLFVRRCFSDGRFEIDNGLTERTLREPCMGRKAYLFSGSAEAADRLAGAYTLVQSCRRLGFPARDYLVDVLQKLEAGWPLRRIGELVPDRWALEHRGIAPAPQTQQ